MSIEFKIKFTSLYGVAGNGKKGYDPFFAGDLVEWHGLNQVRTGR